MDSLPEQDALLVLAEVSVAIAGFAGIMVVVGRPRDELARAKAKALVGGAVGLVLFSLLPVVLALTELAAEAIWRIGSGLVVLWAALYYLMNRSDLSLIATSGLLVPAFVLGDGVVFLALTAAALGYPPLGYSFLYIATLLWCLCQVLVFFVQFMSELWSPPSA